MDILKDNTERLLGIDFGEKRIGIAISDPLMMFPIPLKTISNDKNLWSNINKTLGDYNVVKIIVGHPLREDGTKSKITLAAEKFADQLKTKFKIDVELVDERYSSSIAMEHILESVPKKKRRQNKSLVDMNAAAVILGDFLKNH